MAPPSAKRQRTSGPQSKTRQQGTLSFRSTKGGVRQPQVKDEKAAKAADVEKVEDSSIADDAPTQEVQPPAGQADADSDAGDHVADSSEDEAYDEDQAEIEKKALDLPESKLKSYWSSKERERKAPRVHQQDLSMREKILREFDMSSRYGPSVGIQRQPRWHRAHELGMNPPLEVLAVLVKDQQHSRKSSAGKELLQRSIIDELTLSSRLRGDGVAEA